VFNWEFRLLPGDDADAILARIEAKTCKIRERMQAVYPQADIVTRNTSYAPDLNPEENRQDMETMLLHISQRNTCKAVSFATEAGIFQKNHIPALICGPGNILQAHKPNEHIAISQIEACVEFMERLREELAL
jgi:acetylornithine deacetylase